MVQPKIYITRGQLPHDVEEQRKVWYRERHAPDVLSVGFWSARGFKCENVPNNCNVYEIADVGILSSDAYMEMRKADTFSPTVMNAFTYLSASIYSQSRVCDTAGTMLSDFPTVRSPYLAMLSFDTLSDDVTAWFKERVVKLADMDGVRTLRLWEQTDSHPLFSSKEPRFSAVMECAHNPVSAVSLLNELTGDGGLAFTTAKVELATRWYALVREDVFDNPV